MYRPPTKRQREAQARRLEAMRRGKDRARLGRLAPGRAAGLPDLRRIVTVTDFDGPEPVTHTMEMRKSKRVDSYCIYADGQPWKICGWSTALAGLRKAFLRVPSPRSDVWS